MALIVQLAIVKQVLRTYTSFSRWLLPGLTMCGFRKTYSPKSVQPRFEPTTDGSVVAYSITGPSVLNNKGLLFSYIMKMIAKTMHFIMICLTIYLKQCDALQSVWERLLTYFGQKPIFLIKCQTLYTHNLRYAFRITLVINYVCRKIVCLSIVWHSTLPSRHNITQIH